MGNGEEINLRHLFRLTDWTPDDVHRLLDRAEAIAAGGATADLSGTFAANLFFEPSTRTRFSFEIAEKRLGMHVLNVTPEASSVKKGETLYDTLKTLEAIGVSVAVVRHPEEGYYEGLREGLGLSVINAGDGCGHHPTQTLIDLYTIRREFGTLKDVTVAIIGDLRHSRVARSNAEMLVKMGACVVLSGPPEWRDPDFPGEYVAIDEAVRCADVVNLLRIQLERHNGGEDELVADYHRAYGLTAARARLMKPGAIIMHPAPVNRGVELADELVEAPNARIFAQMQAGPFVRMAVLEWAFKRERVAKSWACC